MSRASVIYVLLMGPAILTMVADLAIIFRLTVWRRPAGIVAVLFGGLLTLKLWVALVLAYFTWIILRPGTLTYEARVSIATGLAVYILAQSAGMLVALARWFGPPAWLVRKWARRGALPGGAGEGE
jgi:hypothetical protein